MGNLVDASAENERSPTHPTLEGDHPIWTWEETVKGATITLVPYLGLAALSFLGASQPQQSSQRLSPAADLIGAALTVALQLLLEGGFLIAPLWFAVIKPRRLAAQQGLPPPTIGNGLRALGFRPTRPWVVLAGALIGMTAIYLAGYLYTLLAEALNFSINTNVDLIIKDAATAPYTTLALLISAVVIAPVCEEVFFRSFFFQGLRLRIHVWLAVILSASLFGLEHGAPGSLVLLIVIGVLLAILRWRTRSIWPGIALHALNNAVSAIVVLGAIHF